MVRNLRLQQLYEMAKDLLADQAKLETCDFETLKTKVRSFVSDTTYAVQDRAPFQLAYRAQRNAPRTGFHKVQRLLYHPDGNPHYGRANAPGKKILYASWNPDTALEEVHARPGEVIQLVTLRSRVGAKVPAFVIGDYQKFYMSGRMTYVNSGMPDLLQQKLDANRSEFLCSVFIDSTMSKFFRAEVRDDLKYDYKITAAFSEVWHGRDAVLMFPSVHTVVAMNLAIPASVFENSYEVLETSVIEINGYYGHGIYDEPTVLARSPNFHKDGTIDWQATKQRQYKRHENGGLEESPETIPGWRANP